ncbi:zinc finger and BTB domain-containing protein 8A-like [Emys orbicularis]|uniref:zinc finger and BTB domain-containing protein 8A-like n=1 Tax=Emys orbicularis TaxID=82168 RepID=UPI0031FE12C2
MEISSHQFHLLQQLNEQRKQDLFCDCSILVEGKVFKAHRNVLFASSGYFKMLLSQSSETSQPTTATFEVFSPDTFTVILDFVYSGKLSLTGQNVIEVMSAASYLQMTDILSVCKTFIKSSLEINEKEKDHYFALSAKRVNSRFDCPPFYRSRRKVKSNPISSHLIPDQKAGMVNEYSWANNRNHSSSQMNVQLQETQLSKRGQKLGSVKKRQRRLGLSQSHDFLKYKSNKPDEASGSCSASETNPISHSKEQIQFDTENNTAHTGYRCDQESKVIPKKWIFSVTDDLLKMRFKCPFCTHTVKRRADMKRHLRCHTGERPYPCEACGKKFTRLEHLRSHFQTIHQAGKLICRKCKNHVTDLTGHVVQQGTRRYRLCKECLVEAGIDSIRDDLDVEHPLTISLGDNISGWHLDEEHRSDVEMEDEPDKFVIQQVNDDSTDETEEKVKPNPR